MKTNYNSNWGFFKYGQNGILKHLQDSEPKFPYVILKTLGLPSRDNEREDVIECQFHFYFVTGKQEVETTFNRAFLIPLFALIKTLRDI